MERVVAVSGLPRGLLEELSGRGSGQILPGKAPVRRVTSSQEASSEVAKTSEKRARVEEGCGCRRLVSELSLKALMWKRAQARGPHGGTEDMGGHSGLLGGYHD